MKKIFDKEYNTQFTKEVQFLKQHNIRYSFVKIINGITTYKYSKSAELFYWLSIFYENIESLKRSD